MSKSFFRLTIFSTARNGFFLLSGCHESLVLYFFSFPTVENRFPPDDEQILKNTNSVRSVYSFKFQSSTRNFPFFSRYVQLQQMLKVILSSFKNLRGIVRRAKVGIGAKSVFTDSCDYVVKADSSSKIFQPTKWLFSIFLQLHLTTEAMGTGGLRAYSLSHSDKVNAGAKPAKCTSASL